MSNAMIDLEAGTITLSLADFARLTGKTTLVFAIAPVHLVELPDVGVFHQGTYTQVHVTDEHGSYWVCSCNDFRYRRQSAEGESPTLNGQCKHLIAARYHRTIVAAYS